MKKVFMLLIFVVCSTFLIEDKETVLDATTFLNDEIVHNGTILSGCVTDDNPLTVTLTFINASDKYFANAIRPWRTNGWRIGDMGQAVDDACRK